MPAPLLIHEEVAEMEIENEKPLLLVFISINAFGEWVSQSATIIRWVFRGIYAQDAICRH